jgi:hypothetical protein
VRGQRSDSAAGIALCVVPTAPFQSCLSECDLQILWQMDRLKHTARMMSRLPWAVG